ncbi:MAG: SDR family NAD(P)-dependent oxidoreductase [Candidatus Omnitrophica bacterium]|nr:SDR family NAD(P)-dependent oxidoreductase [Candidatus Omnitrophota bacterium]
MKTVLITGCGGFIGSHLAECFLARGWDVVGMVHRNQANLKHLEGRLEICVATMEDRAAVEELVARARPEAVVHLAAQSHIMRSWQQPAATLQMNVLGAIHLLEAVRACAPQAVVVVVGSSAQYGRANRGTEPCSEESSFQPSSPYGVSKVAQDLLAQLYGRSYGLRTIRVRPFAIMGPRKDWDAVSEFARGIIQAERGSLDPLRVGNLDVVRDFMDVRDSAAAMVHLVEHGKAGEAYNLCTGIGTRLGDLLQLMIAASGVSLSVVPDPSLLRRSDDLVLVGNSRKLRETGWQPAISLSQSVQDTLAFWRRQVNLVPEVSAL